MHLCTLMFFSFAAICFGALCFITNPIANVVVIVIGIMASNAAATMLWSVYCPSLCDTGLVSGITGFLDFISYVAAALASLTIPILVKSFGWRNIIVLLFLLMVFGIVICVPYFLRKKENKAN